MNLYVMYYRPHLRPKKEEHRHRFDRVTFYHMKYKGIFCACGLNKVRKRRVKVVALKPGTGTIFR